MFGFMLNDLALRIRYLFSRHFGEGPVIPWLAIVTVALCILVVVDFR